MTRELATQKLRLQLIDVLDDSVDPSAGGGVAAAIGSFFLRNTTGQTWIKTGAAATAWLQLQQSFAWLSVMDYGAVPNGVTDCTAAFAAAIADANAMGGNVVYVPYGTYVVSQIAIAGLANVQIVGAGPGSVIKWVFDAAGAAGSLFTLSGGAQRIVFKNLRLDGSGLTNPDAGRTNHLVQVGTGVGAVTETLIAQCELGGMVAGSGDGVHLDGAAGNVVSRVMIDDCVLDGCSHFAIGGEQGYEFLWITNCHLTNCETEIGLVATSDVNVNGLVIVGNILVHTSATVRHAARLEGGATTLITRLVFSDNVILNGFVTLNRAQYAHLQDLVVTSGAYASADPVLRVFGNVSDATILDNIIDRSPGASAGPCVTIEKSTNSPTRFNLGTNILLQEVATAGFIVLVDVADYIVQGNLCRATDAGATAIDAIDVQAVTVDATDAVITKNMITAAAGTFRSAVRLYCNGANVTNVSVNVNDGAQIDVGIRHELGGGGTFNGQYMAGDNNWNAATSNFSDVGITVYPRIGFNACTFGPNLFEGAGTPEGNVTARAASMYLNRSGGQATSVYYRDSGTGATGWIGIGGAPLIFGTGSTTTAATAVYFAPGYITTSTATEVQEAMTRSGTIRNLRVQVAGAGTDSQNVTFTVRKNGVDTALTCSIDNAAAGLASDLTHSFTIAAGDLISISIVKAAGVTAGQTNAIASMEIA